MTKICPLMSDGPFRNDQTACLENNCRLWIRIINTEGLFEQMCAFEAMALKNSEGKVRA